MFRRAVIHFLLVFLFAFTQMGVATHEISHYSDPAKHSQQDKNSPTDQCGKCVSYAQVGSGLQAQSYTLPTFEAQFQTASHYSFHVFTLHRTVYAARAPPLTLKS